jgi:hypothetical protein
VTPDWGDVPTWGLFAGAVVTSVFAILAFRKQSAEVGILQAEAKRDAAERHRAQAALVYMTEEDSRGWRAFLGAEPLGGFAQVAEPPFVTVEVRNTGEQPVYDLRVLWFAPEPVSRDGGEQHFGTVGPAGMVSTKRALEDREGRLLQLAAVAYFRDAAGARWTLTADGRLRQVPDDLPAYAALIATGAALRESAGSS